MDKEMEWILSRFNSKYNTREGVSHSHMMSSLMGKFGVKGDEAAWLISEAMCQHKIVHPLFGEDGRIFLKAGGMTDAGLRSFLKKVKDANEKFTD